MNDFDDAIIQPNINNKNESDYKKDLLNLIYDTNNINVKTDLSQDQIMAVARMELFADYYNVSILKSFSQNFKELQISKDRQGRKEGTAILSSANALDYEGETSLFKKLVNDK